MLTITAASTGRRYWNAHPLSVSWYSSFCTMCNWRKCKRDTWRSILSTIVQSSAHAIRHRILCSFIVYLSFTFPADSPTRTKFCSDYCSRASGTPYSITITFHTEWAHSPLLNYFTLAHLDFVRWNCGLDCCCMPAVLQVSTHPLHLGPQHFHRRWAIW